MGQNQSHQPPAPKGPPARPTSQPSSKLVSQLGPQSPSYVNPENKVLPIILPPSAKSLLRPVSQELSDYHPEYKEIFRSNSLDNNDENIANGNVTQNGTQNDRDMNGNVSSRMSNGHVPNLDNRNGDINRRPVSMYQNGTSNNVKGHRRNLSASSSLYSRENVIVEHPDEPSFYEERPKKVTLPAKSTFDMPYSENLTYAQLAEYRRNQTLAELERKTGRKIEDLSAYAESPSTFERCPSTRSAKSSKSTGSGVSKKKSRAPAPPGLPPNPPPSKSAPSTPRGTNMHTPPARPNQPPPILKSYSLDREPPADYEDAEPRKNVTIKRSASSASRNMKSTPTSPPPPPAPPISGILRNSNHRINRSQLPQTQSTKNTNELIKIRSPPVRQGSFNKTTAQTETNKFLTEIQKAAETRAFRRQISEPASLSPPTDLINNNVKENLVFSVEPSLDFPNSKDETSSNSSKQAPPPVAMKPNRSSSSSFERQNSATSESGMSIQSSLSGGDPVRRLSSLLQHDIKLAAQAKATKIVKHATPVKEKPKDPAQVFREQLAKAAYERDSRAKTGPTIDEQLKAVQSEEKKKDEASILFYTEQVTVKRTDSLRQQNESFQKESTNNQNNGVKKTSETEKEVFTIKKNEMPKTEFPIKKTSEQSGEVVKHPRQMLPDSPNGKSAKDSYRNSIYASTDWTPELDLESDDNISDSEVMTSSLGKSNGFKSTVLPSKVNQMNYKGKKQKGKERKFKKNVEPDEPKKKHGSIKKFKNSVHKSVLNAFGSISKASGKVLKKSKSEEMEYVDDAPKNWTLTSTSSTPTFSTTPVQERAGPSDGQMSDRALKYMVPNGHQDHESSSSEDEELVPNQVMFETNGHIESNDETDDEENRKYLKRAGVAYVSKNGQIVVLPEYEKIQPGETRPGEYDNRAPKLKTKKKKFTFDATVRRKEREQLNEQISADTVLKEKKREEERHKEIETEMEIKRTRELEARERLQRLEMQAQIHQQLLQQQQYGIISNPPLPPPNGFQQGYNPVDFSQLFAQPGFGLPFATQTGYATPVFSNSVPNMSYDLGEYMRMMGVQSSTPSTSQHYAYSMLNGGINWPQANLMAYQNKSQQDDSARNQVYQTWTGPKKQIVSTSNSQNTNGTVTISNNSRRTSEYSNDESDSSAGLSPQRTNASLSASKNNISDKDNTYGYKSQISVTTVYTPGFGKNGPSTGSDQNTDR